jgi:hypothetical protein
LSRRSCGPRVAWVRFTGEVRKMLRKKGGKTGGKKGGKKSGK